MPPKKYSPTRKNNSFKLSGTQITLSLVGGALIALAALVIYGASQSSSATTMIEGVQEYRYPDGQHQEGPIAYGLQPPAGDRHNPRWQNCGVYDKPIANELAVHTLEHGAVWLTYQPNIAAAELLKLQTITRQSPYRLLSPYPDQPAPIIVTAWGYQLKVDRADDPRMLQFIKKYEQNPFGPEPGATCTGGIGTPG